MWQRISIKIEGLGDWIKQHPKRSAVVLAISILLVGVYLWTKFSLNLQWMETEGEILVDEPKVYTRERLVNDRFTEEAWLGKQLDINPADFSAPQAKISSANSQQILLTLKTAKSDDNSTKPGETSHTSLQPDAAGPEKAQSDTAPSRVDIFTEMLDYRDKVRNELMRIQLDDRHDIEGNTLYRLNFDTAVIPGASTHAAAAILVTIFPPDNTDLESIFANWRAETQDLVDGLVIDKVKAVQSMNIAAPFPPAEQIEFEGFLRKEVCEAVKSLSEELYGSLTGSQAPEISCRETQQEPWFKDLLGIITGASKKNVHYDCSEHENTFFCEVEKLMGSYSMNFAQAKYNKNAQIFFEELNKIKGLTADEVKELSKKINRTCISVPNKPNASGPRQVYYNNEKGEVSVDNNQQQGDQHSWKPISCMEAPPPTNRIVVIMGLLDRLKAIKAVLTKEEKLDEEQILSLVKEIPGTIDKYPRVIEELVRPYACGKPEDKDNSLFHKALYKYIDQQYTLQCKTNPDGKSYEPDEGIQETSPGNIGQLIVSYYAKKLQEQELNNYFTPVIEGCDMQQCRLVLYETEDAVENLKKKLDDVNQTFSYAVTPQMQTQRISVLNKQKNQLNALINASLLGGGKGVDGLIQQLTTLEKELEILERNPIVVGFGDWQYEKDKPNIETRFGWVIQPRLTGNQDLFGSPEFRQVSDHYSLSAVISIPSWWNEIKVQVNKCWLKTTELSTADSSLCENASHSQQSPNFTIRVPGTTDDIHQKLGFEVVKTPRLFPPNKQQQIFEVGREARVLLEGERLWRSTVVMLDNQKADSIEVLPDMKAVLAKFTCLNPAAGSGEIMETYLYDDSSFPKISDNSLLIKSKKQPGSKPTTPENTPGNAVSPNNPDGSPSGKKNQAPPNTDQPSATATDNQTNPNGNSQNNNASSSSENSEAMITVGCMPMPGSQSQHTDIKYGCIANVRLWTSEASTNPLQVVLKPFVQRYVGEAPCYVNKDIVETARKNASQVKH